MTVAAHRKPRQYPLSSAGFVITDALTTPLTWPARGRARVVLGFRRFSGRVRGRWRNHRDHRARSRLRLDPGLARQLLAVIEEPVFPGVEPLKTTVFEKQKCQNCGGLHSRVCPAVSEIEYHPDGKVRRVAYFAHGTWREDAVLWLEDVQEAAAFEDDLQPAR